MKTLLRILLSLVVLVALLVAILFIGGGTLPVDHSTSDTAIIPAEPSKVFALITNPAIGATWRPAVKSVKMLPPDAGRDHWIEDLGHGQTMTFLAVKTEPPLAGFAERDVLLDVPGASYGGTWTYKLKPGPLPGTTSLTITEVGYIHPPIYRFLMHHVLGMNYNIEIYFKDLIKAVKS